MIPCPTVDVVDVESTGYSLLADVGLRFAPDASVMVRRVRVTPDGPWGEHRLSMPSVRWRADVGGDYRDAVTLPKPWRPVVIAAILERARERGLA